MPLAPDEDDIAEYHDIVKLFEDAHGRDLSRFRIALDRVLPSTIASPQGRWQTRHPTHKVVEYRYFRGQLRGLIDFLVTVINSRPS